MHNKTARIITIVVLIVILVGGFFAYLYRGKLKGLFSRASATVDLGFASGTQPLLLNCPAKSGTNGGQVLNAQATLQNWDATTTATGVAVQIHAASTNNSNPSFSFPGTPSWMTVKVNKGVLNGDLWTIGSLAPGETATITMTGSIPSDQSFTLTGEVSSVDQNDVDSTPNNWTTTNEDDEFKVACATQGVGGKADLGITQQASVTSPSVGQGVVLTLTAQNLGTTAVSNIVVTDLLPSGLNFSSAKASQGAYVSTTGVWAVGSLAGGASASLTINATVTNAGTLSNNASISAAGITDSNSANNQASVVITAAGGGGISGGGSQCLPSTQNAAINQVVSFQVIASPGELVDIWDAPGGTPSSGQGETFSTKYSTVGTKTVVVHSDNNTGTCTVVVTAAPATGDLVCSPASQNAAINQVVNFQVTPVPGITDPFTWNAPDGTPASGSGQTFSTKYATSGNKTVTVHLQNSTGTCTVVVAGPPPPATTLTCSPANQTVSVGQTANFTAVGGGLTHNWSAPGGTPSGGAVSAVGSGSSITSTFSTSYSSSGAKVVTVTSGSAQATCNVIVSGGGGGGLLTDLGVVKSVSSSSVPVNSNVVFSMVVTNNGPTNATGVTVSDPIVSGLTYVSHVVSQGTYDQTTGVWNLGSLAVGANASLSITTTVTSTSTVTNVITITNVNPADTNSANNTAQASVTGTSGGGGCTSNCGGGYPTPYATPSGGYPTPSAGTPLTDLSLTKVASNKKPLVGTQITYILNLANAGPDTATGVSVQDTIPAGETFVSSLPSQGTFDSSTGVWSVGSLPAGSSTALQLTVRVDKVGSITNTGEVISSNQPDIDSTPNNHNPNEDDQASVTIVSHSAGILPAAGIDSRGMVAVGVSFLLLLFIIQFFIPTSRRRVFLSFAVDSHYSPPQSRQVSVADRRIPKNLKW